MARRKKGPWTILKTRTVYKSPWMEVREDKVISPTGQKTTYGTVRIKPGVVVIALDADLSVYLLKEYQYGIGKSILKAVAGGIEVGQSPLQAAKEELLEETGLRTRKLTRLGRHNAFPSFLHGPMHLYLAENLSQSECSHESTEVIEVIKMPFKRALKLAESGKIDHAATVMGLMKIAALKKIR